MDKITSVCNKLIISENIKEDKTRFVNDVMKRLSEPETWEDFHNKVKEYMKEGATLEEACEWAMQD